MKITIGADPELFLSKDGKPFSAYGLIPGNKKAPHKVDQGAVQVDGMALEFNIDPVETLEQFNHNIDSVLKTLRNMVPKDYIFDFASSVKFDDDHFKAQPNEATVIGCDPDYNPYTLKEYAPPMTNDSATRAAGGHVHVGWGSGFDVADQAHFKACAKMAKAMDYFVGIPAILLDNSPSSDARMATYGRPGAFRPKPYGVEYRFLSNFWVQNEHYRELVFNQTQRAFNYLIDDSNKGKEFGLTYIHNVYTYRSQLAKYRMSGSLSDTQRGNIRYYSQSLGEFAGQFIKMDKNNSWGDYKSELLEAAKTWKAVGK